MKGRVVVKIQESAENYLETIHMLSKHKPYVRSIDIANELSFSKPSVSVAMKNLRENGYIHMDDQGHITLTQTGQDIADKMYERHIMLLSVAVYGDEQKNRFIGLLQIDAILGSRSFQAIKKHITQGNELPADMKKKVISKGATGAADMPNNKFLSYEREVVMLKDLVKNVVLTAVFQEVSIIPYEDLKDMVGPATDQFVQNCRGLFKADLYT